MWFRGTLAIIVAALLLGSPAAAVTLRQGGSGTPVPFVGPGSPGFLPTCSSKFAAAPSTPVNCPGIVAFRDFSTLTYYGSNPIIPQNSASYNAGGTSGPYLAASVSSGGNYYAFTNCTVSGANRDLWQNHCLYDGADVLHWTLLSNAYSAGGGSWDDNYLLHDAMAPPGTCSLATYCDYYSARNSAQSVWKIGVVSASSLGGSWTKYGSNPLTFSGCGVTNPGLPSIIQIGSTLYMYVVVDGNNGKSISYFTSPVGDGLTWTCGGTALPVPLSTDWDFSGLVGTIDPFVFKNSHGFYEMVYTAYFGSSQAIGYAVSADGITWFKYQAAAIMTTGSLAYPGSYYIGDGVLYEDGTTFSVLFNYDDGISLSAGTVSQMPDHLVEPANDDEEFKSLMKWRHR